VPVPTQPFGEQRDLRALAGTFDAFECDEETGFYRLTPA
jgi:hypothetical protein